MRLCASGKHSFKTVWKATFTSSYTAAPSAGIGVLSGRGANEASDVRVRVKTGLGAGLAVGSALPQYADIDRSRVAFGPATEWKPQDNDILVTRICDRPGLTS